MIASDNSISITIEHLSTGYRTKHGQKVVAKDVNASLKRGQFTCLLGPNGAGKSTLLKTLSSMLPPLSGKVMIGGEDLRSMSALQLAHKIGVVLTDRLMVSNMTVHELVALGRSPYTGFWGKLSHEDQRIVDEAIEQVHIQELGQRMIQTLSDGERQKVMIAKSLAQCTPIIFLDEPTAFLDYPSKVEIFQLLLRLTREKNLTVFLSTHDLELALQISDEVWLIDKQLGVTIGCPEDLALNGSLSRYFKREGVEFDVDSGLFKISGNRCGSVQVAGSGVRRSMVCKALQRIGLVAVDEECGILVEVSDDCYLVNGQSHSTIASLLESVGHLSGIGDK